MENDKKLNNFEKGRSYVARLCFNENEDVIVEYMVHLNDSKDEQELIKEVEDQLQPKRSTYTEKGYAEIHHCLIKDMPEFEDCVQLFKDEKSKELYGFKVDENWQRKLMPTSLITKRYKKKLLKEIQEESNKDEPDEEKMLKNYSKIKTMKYLNEKTIYKLAVQQLNKRVEGGESDKPAIRKMLEDKINNKD